MKRMLFSTKLLLSQISIFIGVYALILLIIPHIMYGLVNDTEATRTMQYTEQVTMRIEQQLNEIERFSEFLSNDDELYRKLKQVQESKDENLEAELRLYLSKLIQKDAISSYRVLGIYIDIAESGCYTNTVGLPSELKQLIDEEITPTYMEQEDVGLYINPFNYRDKETNSLFGNTFTRAFGYVRNYNRNGLSGKIIIFSSFDEIQYIIENLSSICDDYVLLSSDQEMMISAKDNTQIDYEKVLSQSEYGRSYWEKYDIEKDGIYTIRYLKNGGWKILTYMNREDVLEYNIANQYTILIFVAVFGVIVILVMIIIVKRFTRSLSELAMQMKAISAGDFKARVRVVSGDEIGMVGDAFNLMAEHLEDSIKKIVEKEKLEQTMRYGLLISQVDPHFIYNTMNTITYLAQKNRVNDVIVVNKAMIEILKDRLRIEVSEVFDSLKQEINVVKQYLMIQEYRYEGIFKVKYEIEEKCMQCYIAKNMIQPLIENALSHGLLQNKDENGEPLGGCICINIFKDQQFIHINITDNGVGMTEEEVAEISRPMKHWERGGHIGIRNIRERMKYIYYENAKMEIHSKKDFGTTVSLILPLKYDDSDSIKGL